MDSIKSDNHKNKLKRQDNSWREPHMAEKKKILFIVEAMGGGVFTYIVDVVNELVNNYDMYIAYVVRKQILSVYKDYFNKRSQLLEAKK